MVLAKKELELLKKALEAKCQIALKLYFLNKHLYLTEDTPDGGFYRFIPDSLTKEGNIDFSSGKLQIAVLNGEKTEGH